MKKISKLALNELSRKEISQKQMGKIKGGRACGCACCYEGGGGGSDSHTNGQANCSGSQDSYSCGKEYIYHVC